MAVKECDRSYHLLGAAACGYDVTTVCIPLRAGTSWLLRARLGHDEPNVQGRQMSERVMWTTVVVVLSPKLRASVGAPNRRGCTAASRRRRYAVNARHGRAPLRDAGRPLGQAGRQHAAERRWCRTRDAIPPAGRIPPAPSSPRRRSTSPARPRGNDAPRGR